MFPTSLNRSLTVNNFLFEKIFKPGEPGINLLSFATAGRFVQVLAAYRAQSGTMFLTDRRYR